VRDITRYKKLLASPIVVFLSMFINVLLVPIDPRFFKTWIHTLLECDRRINNFSVIFTGEITFTRDSISSFHNMHVLAAENPHAVLEWSHQLECGEHRFSVNVWAGIFGDQLIGPCTLPFG